MNLLIDSGNSFIKWALTADESFITGSQCLTTAVSSLHEKWANFDVPARVIVSNVAGESVASEIRKAVAALWRLDAEFIVSSQNCCGLTNRYRKLEQLGVDRWMAMLAAYRMTQDPVIVVDCGTAVTIDLVNARGLFVGGVIMPGLNTAFQSLRADTDAVEEIRDTSTVASAVALSTEEAVLAGVLFGLAGGIERVVREQSSEIDRIPVIYITGGDAEKLVPYLTMPVVLQPDLVLHGLRIVASQNN
ncbi:MAG TPA: type III pantothenate kinase [Gammaproteobacteria bacterium]|nr:type III pantothenate kinase [Gammaproteobacteria bacterium]